MDGRARLAWNLRSLRAERGLSQETLAVDTGVAAPYVSGIERGLVNPTIDVLDRLAAALGIEIDRLLRAYDTTDTPTAAVASRSQTQAWAPPGGREGRLSLAPLNSRSRVRLRGDPAFATR